MHAPDGFLTAGTALSTGALSAATVGVLLRTGRDSLSDRRLPLAGTTGAFIFAAQMVNFPVAAGTTGHLLGGALAAVLLGPRVATLILSTIVIVQALLFADGGLTALGYNVLNMAIVTSLGGYAVYRIAMGLLPQTRSGVTTAAGLAGMVSVLLSAMALSIEWLFGASAPVSFNNVFASVVSIHIPIAMAEGAITAATVGAVMASRPDLVQAAEEAGVQAGPAADRRPIGGAVAAGAVLTLTVAAVVSQFAASEPDGLERASIDNGIEADDAWYSDLPLSDYAVSGIDDPSLSLAVAGVAGAAVTALAGVGLLSTLRRRSDRSPEPDTRARVSS